MRLHGLPVTTSPSVLGVNVASLEPSKFGQCGSKSLDVEAVVCVVLTGVQHRESPHGRLLCSPLSWQRHQRSADARNEYAPLHLGMPPVQELTGGIAAAPERRQIFVVSSPFMLDDRYLPRTPARSTIFA
jgi:hypothetical protein